MAKTFFLSSSKKWKMMSSSCSDIILIYISSHNPPLAFPTMQTNRPTVVLCPSIALNSVCVVVASCVLAFLKARVWVTHIWSQSVEHEQWSVEGVFCVSSCKGSRYRLFISQWIWPRATSSTLLWGAFDFWRKGRDTPSLTQSPACIPQWLFSLC